MKFIPLTHGKVAKVDDADFDYLSRYSWYAQKDVKTGAFYAATSIDGRTTQMHRLLFPSIPQLDHEDGDGLNNQRSNLREATHSQNAQNRKRCARNSSGFKGVSVHSCTSRWQARICILGKEKFLGLFNSPKIAALAYDFAALRYFGEFARLNFPQHATQ